MRLSSSDCPFLTIRHWTLVKLSNTNIAYGNLLFEKFVAILNFRFVFSDHLFQQSAGHFACLTRENGFRIAPRDVNLANLVLLWWFIVSTLLPFTL
ncbi:unnamed protein product [Cercopithifilaria johnstoni]|uniref:Uncharacterized protein n=1 Tax=Cercopithifilaria johnstoni TaxID=2874296 RepID=A0A8J2PY78_9BILA|nr:unnamed protein product [Cercopithifilaria johnstoni]